MARVYSPNSPEFLEKITSPIKSKRDYFSSLNKSLNLPKNFDQSTTYSKSPQSISPRYTYGKSNKPKVRPVSTSLYPDDSFTRPNTRSPIPYDKQSGRPDFIKFYPDVNASRFVAFNTKPSISSATKRVRNVDMSKMLERRNETAKQDTKWYEIKWSSVERQTAKPGPRFDKRIGRKSLQYTHFTDLIYPNVKYQSVEAKMRVPDMDLTIQRGQHNILPSFMVKIEDRGAINYITDKSLVMSNYQNRGYYKVPSSFPEMHRRRRRKS